MMHVSSRVYPNNKLAHQGNQQQPSGPVKQTKCKASTPVFSIYTYCSVNHNLQCPVKYRVLRQSYDEDAAGLKGHVQLTVTRTGEHQHAKNGNEQVRGAERKKLAKRIVTDHGGSAFEAMLADKATNDFVPPLNTYQTVKSELSNNDMPHYNWLLNLQHVALHDKELDLHDFIHD